MSKRKEEVEPQEKQKMFIKEQIGKMPISSVEKDMLRSKWGEGIFKSEKEINKILNRKEIL